MVTLGTQPKLAVVCLSSGVCGTQVVDGLFYIGDHIVSYCAVAFHWSHHIVFGILCTFLYVAMLEEVEGTLLSEVNCKYTALQFSSSALQGAQPSCDHSCT